MAYGDVLTTITDKHFPGTYYSLVSGKGWELYWCGRLHSKHRTKKDAAIALWRLKKNAKPKETKPWLDRLLDEKYLTNLL